ncbi:SCP2 sterol-binding domain-containing protein [Rhodotorula paludigena]|uniref:SCP2 sterol-binding domain-containing protein n=1 Tax=Rhodotorula paludigena TaxID=86838 RepID=UPI003170FD09
MSSTDSDAQVNDRLVRAALADPAITIPGFDSSRVFALISVVLSSPSSPRKRLLRAIKTVYLFQIDNDKGETGTWWLDMRKKGRLGKLAPGQKAPLKPDVIVKISDRDFVGLATGRLTPQKLFAAKRLTIRGDLDRALSALRVLSQEREKLETLAGPAQRDPQREKGVWAEYKPPTGGVVSQVKETVEEGVERIKAKL